MADEVESSSSRKRSLPLLEALPADEAPAGKRACLEPESPQTSPSHLDLLEEFCDLEGEDAEPCLSASAASPSAQEDLVAEMMKSLEKVIEEGETREPCEPSISPSAGVMLASSAPAAPSLVIADLSWADEGGVLTMHDIPTPVSELQDTSPERDERIQILLQASDEEFGIPASCSSSDLGDDSAFQEWASLLDVDGGSNFSGINWTDMPLTHLEEARDIFEPIVLF